MFTTPRQKNKGYVYCNGKLIARQDPNWILWQHENPFSGTRAISSRDGLGGVETEPDAFGVDMGLFDPFPVPEQWEPPVDGLVGLLPTSGIPSGRCILDDIPIFCADAEHLLSIGAAQFKPPDTVWDGTRWRFVEFNRDRREYVYHVNTVLKKFTVKENEEDDGETYYGRVRYYNRVTVMSGAEELFSLFAFRPSPQRGGIEFLPNGGSYGDKGQLRLVSIIGLLETNDRCRRAFEIVGLQSINDTVEKGVVIGPATLLNNPANNSLMGIVEGARRIYNDEFGTSSARGATIRNIPGQPNPFLNPHDQRLRMFFSTSAFSGSFEDTWEDVVHEFIHAGGQAKKPSWWPGGHDLSGYEWYGFLQESCKPK